MRPLILVVGRWTDQQGQPGRQGIFSTRTVMDVVSRAGGEPVLAWPDTLERAERLVGLADGVILPGGNDLDLRPFGVSDVHPREEHSPPEQDAADVSVARAALRAERPVLAICRGMQVLNVVCGCTLHVHQPEHYGERIAHRLPPRDTSVHAVEIDPDSRLAQILGTTHAQVRSWHHQAIDRIGEWVRLRTPQHV